ncbi:metabotropic glutamate receptor 3-like isoform X2 [Mercenaria mercenaria]|uniref:metabotropic glutamate receptor 3-like isoform X2 n=1 Tax=Mercenaria mercenaria TaxID=6596 RepID=UPI00234EE625|nr:metabotropic glutamate receptor 3-like isoform X2 [Mercenaria mercenaria]
MFKFTKWNLSDCLFQTFFTAVLFLESMHSVANTNLTNSPAPISASIEGDVMLGGLFPVHQKGESDIPCGIINADRGIQRVEAMLFTLDRINKDDSILPGIKLGTTIFDTCARGTYALEQSLEYIRASFSSLDASEFVCGDGSEAEAKYEPKTVAGVIGGSYSSVSIQVANLLRLFKIPQISYASTSAQLSDKTRYEYFARTVPPDNYQALAMVDIVQFFNWTYVSTVASEGEYGVSGIEFFQQEARSRNICLAETLKISSNPTHEEYSQIIDKLLKKTNAKVVILFLREEDAKGVLDAASHKNISGKFTWIAADGWGTQQSPVKHNELAAEGALTIILQATHIPEFDDYFLKLNPNHNKRNPWFREYWKTIHNCRYADEVSPRINKPVNYCTGYEVLSKSKYRQESKVQFIYDAVYAIAHSIDRMRKDKCRSYSRAKDCHALNKINGELLKKYILNTTFNDGYGATVKFSKQGDAFGRYSIMNYQLNRSTRQYEYRQVGSWVNDLSLNIDNIVWAGGTKDLPFSRCSQPCLGDEMKHVGEDGDMCCWVCIKCQPFEYLKDEYTCKDCGEGRWPYEDRLGCYQLEEQYMRFDSVYSIVPLVLSGLGVFATLFVIFAFIRYNDTPVVMASGRELSYMLLSGCLFCYLMTVILILKPTSITCAVQRFGVGFGFAIIYSSLLTKTNRISRIFQSARRSARRPPFISPKSQIIISTILVTLQVIFTIIWLVLEPPGTRLYFPNGKRDEVILKCRTEDLSFLVSLIYNIILIIICTFYAIKTRKIPENFNESKFIGFAMYTTCIIWLAFVPIYFGTLNSFQVQITTLCVSISLSASVALVCLFTPKMYIIFFQPEKNVRKLAMMMNSMHRKTDASQTTCSKLNNSIDAHNSIDNSNSPAELIRLNVQHFAQKFNADTTETHPATEKDSLTSL